MCFQCAMSSDKYLILSLLSQKRSQILQGDCLIFAIFEKKGQRINCTEIEKYSYTDITRYCQDITLKIVRLLFPEKIKLSQLLIILGQF